MISIAMTTYNGEAYIRQQLLSILCQSLAPDEIIICDDRSHDGTVSIIRELMALHPDRRITLVENEENLGYIANFYKAISMTRGDHIFLADQDDVWHTDKILTTMEAMEKSGAALICTRFQLIDRQGCPIDDPAQFDILPFVRNVSQRLTPISFGRLVFGNLVPGCTYCFTRQVRDAYLEVNSRRLIHDYQIMFVSTLVGKAFLLKDALIDYRLHGSNAVGFQKVSEKRSFRLRIPACKPFMVRFLDELSTVLPIPHGIFYRFLYYLRIPYAVFLVRRRLGK